MNTARYEVIAGNVGTVYSGNSLTDAENAYGNYVFLSVQGNGRVQGEPVTLLVNGEPVQEHIPIASE